MVTRDTYFTALIRQKNSNATQDYQGTLEEVMIEFEEDAKRGKVLWAYLFDGTTGQQVAHYRKQEGLVRQ